MNEMLTLLRDRYRLPENDLLPPGGVSSLQERPFIGVKLEENGQGIYVVLWTSVEGAMDCIRVNSRSTGYHLSLYGGDGTQEGIVLFEDSIQERRRNVRLANQLQEAGFEARVEQSDRGVVLSVDADANTASQAVETAVALAERLFGRLGMEMALSNLLAQRSNVIEITDQTLTEFSSGKMQRAVIFSEMTQCIRCRNNWEEVVRLTQQRSDLQFGVVFLNKSRAAFKKWMFSEQCPEIIPLGIVAPTAFLLVDGRVKKFVGTRLDQAPPAPELLERALEDVFNN